MTEITEILKASMTQEVDKLNSISHNLANVNTNGFKRQTFIKAMNQTASLNSDTSPADSVRLMTDFSQGALKQTGEPGDLAISGNGFFVVETDQGERLTRRGNLNISRDGYLALDTGERLLSRSGPITMDSGSYKVMKNGDIYQNERLVGSLLIVEPNQLEGLQYEGGSLFLATSGYVETESSQVVQGFVEASNVDGLLEMTSLLTTVRQFEAGAQVLRGYDDILSSAISELADF